MATLGIICLVISTLSALTGAVIGLSRPGYRNLLRLCQILTFMGSLAALVLLTFLVAAQKPTIIYALEHRAPVDGPLSYRLAAVWAGQAGGLLLWCAETALVALGFSLLRQARALAMLFGVQACLLGIVLLNDPFAGIPAGTDIEAAAGLNPLLMHPMMLIHPPMLFLGYALLAAPFAITLGALWERKPNGWATQVRPWVIVSWLALTAGNGFGASWAYKTFGWGGFWSWDPVENTSFVPWMLATATIHAVWMAHRQTSWLRPAAALSLGGFMTVLYGSFLARSGLLSGASVHAYVEGEKTMVWALGTLLVTGILLSIIFIGRAWSTWQIKPHNHQDAATPVATAWGTATLTTISMLVLIGMSLPMLGIMLNTPQYNALIMPFGVIMMLTLAGATLFNERLQGTVWRNSTIAIFCIVLLAVGIHFTAQGNQPLTKTIQIILAPLLAASCLAVAGHQLWELFSRKRPILLKGHALAHLGVAAFLIGTMLSGYPIEPGKDYLLVGSSMDFSRYKISLQNVRYKDNNTAQATVRVNKIAGLLEIEGNEKFTSPLRRPWVMRHWWGDLYLTPLHIIVEPEFIQNESAPEGVEVPPGVMIEVNLKPGMPMVWGGLLLIALGLCVALARRMLDTRKIR